MMGKKIALGTKHTPEQIRQRAEENQKPVLQLARDGASVLAEHPSVRIAGQVVGIHESMISKCAHGQRKRAGGFVWRFKGEIAA